MKIHFTYLILLCFIAMQAQVKTDSDLFKTLAENDRLLFEEGLNSCNIEQVSMLTHNDFEFYHDKSGINTSKQEFIDAIKNGGCHNGILQNKRILIHGSLEVNALYDNGKLYGAIQMGKHQFGNTIAKFIHLWLIVDGQWKIARVLSYNH